MAELVALPTGGTAGKALTVLTAADAFLGSLGNPNTVRNYGIGIGKTAERLGEARPLASVPNDEVGEALELLWGAAAVNTWNARRASVGSWLAWCRMRGTTPQRSLPGPSGWRSPSRRRRRVPGWRSTG